MRPAPTTMKWSEPITLNEPLMDVRLLPPGLPDDWRKQLADREQAGYERGRKDGEKALREQLVQLRNETVELHKGVLQALKGAVHQVVSDTEDTLIQLTVESAQKLVADMPVSPEMTEAVVREALRRVEDTAEIIVQLNPEDLALLRQHESPLLQDSPDSGPIRFASSQDVTRGGCLVQTRFGVIDARRETKVEQLRKTLSV